MLSNLQNFSYKGFVISKRHDNYVNATQMCAVGKKHFADWYRLKSTTLYVKTLSEAMGIPIAELVEVRNGNQTWVHPSLGINLARWISAEFSVWCDSHIFLLMTTGSTNLTIDPLEEMRLKIEFEKVQMAKYQAEYNLQSFRHSIVTMCPEPVQQKILGYQVVKEVERVEVIVDRNTGKTYDGVNITYITKSLGFPSTASCWKWLESVGYGKNSGKWETQLSAIANQKLNRNDFETIKEIYKDSDDRQIFIGE